MSGRTRKIGKLPKINNFLYLGIFIFRINNLIDF